MTNLPSKYSPSSNENNGGKKKDYKSKVSGIDVDYEFIEENYEKVKKGIGTAGKVGVLGAIGLGLGIRGLKRMIVGDPPSKLRKTLIYGSLAATLGWQACQDDIRPAAKNTYEYLRGEQAQHIERLEEEVNQYNHITNQMEVQRDSLYNLTTDLVKELEEKSQQPIPPDTLYLEKPIPQEIPVPVPAPPETLYLEKEVPQRPPEPAPPETLYINTAPPQTQTRQVSQQGNTESAISEGPCWVPLQQDQTIEDIAREYYGSEEKVNRIRGYRGLQGSNNLPPGYPITLEDCPPETHPHPIPEYEVKKAITPSRWMNRVVRRATDPEDIQFNIELGNNLYDIQSSQGVIYKKP